MKLNLYKVALKQAALLAIFLVAATWTQTLHAQNVSGKVTDQATGEALIGVTVAEDGTLNGTVTDIDGNYRIRLTNAASTLKFSLIGYTTTLIPVENRATIDVPMIPGQSLDEVVVTALGIRKESKKVGYAVSQLEGSSLTQARELNVANSLVGRVAGLNVSGVASGPGGSSRVTLRGNASISGDNQPLYVINGVPMDNSNLGSAGLWGGADFGDGISSLNPDDIETISVLKGATAAALYGSRAKNGVILITTKTGKQRPGIGVEFNSNLTWETPVILTDWQKEYGQGTLGAKPVDAIAGKNTGLYSWGSKLDGSQSFEFDGLQRPYSAKENAADGFYETGFTHVNSLALDGGSEKANYRLSMSNTGNNSVIPNTTLNRRNVNGSVNFRSGRLTTDFKVNYTMEKGRNRPNLSDSPGNANFAINFLPANVDQALLASYDGEGATREGVEQEFNDNQFTTNPYFAAYKFINDSDKDRVLGQAMLRYDFTDWLYVQGRIGEDFYSHRATTVTPTGTAYRPAGDMSEVSLRFTEINSDFLIGANRSFSENFGLNIGVGANRLDRRSERINPTGGTFVVPYLYSLGNLLSRNYTYSLDRVRTNSLYGYAEFDIFNQFYVNVTGRNDWYSTLTNPSYFYPSVSAAWVFSEALDVDFINYAKLRAAYASVGGDTKPYQTALYYNIGGAINGYPIGNITNTATPGGPSAIPNKGLKPLSVTELELGVELRFWENRIGLDLAWYDKKSTNDIVAATISGTSGYSTAIFNLGELSNTGIEALLSITPVRSKMFSWTTSFNFATNKSEVVQLAGDLQTLQVDGSRTQTAYVHQTVGLPFSNIKAFDYKRDDQGRILLSNGLPQQGELIDVGSGIHKNTGGWNNEFMIGNVNLGVLIDFKSGGKIFSGTNSYAYLFGVHDETLVGREGMITAEGIDEATGEANVIAVNPQDYYSALTRAGAPFVYDASFVKLRQITLGYNIPRSWLKKSRIQGFGIALVGRNLAILSKKTPNIDPESNYSNSNAQGLELAGYPSLRTYGVNLNLKF